MDMENTPLTATAERLAEYKALVAEYKDLWHCPAKRALRRRIGKMHFELTQEGLI